MPKDFLVRRSQVTITHAEPAGSCARMLKSVHQEANTRLGSAICENTPTCMTIGNDTRTIIAKSNRNTHLTWKDDPIYNRASTSKPPPPEGSQIPTASLTEINPSTPDISKTKDNAGSAHRSRPCDGISEISLDAETSLCTDGFTEGSMP